MATDTVSADELAKLKEKVEAFEKQLADINKQRANDAAKQKQDAEMIQNATKALENQATAQLALVKAQILLDTARQTQEAQLGKSVADALSEQTKSESSLAQQRASRPFAELLGIKAVTSGMQLPTGKQGTITVAAGTVGTALLRSNEPMLNLLATVAKELAERHPDGAVIVTDAQLDQAYQANFIVQRIEKQTSQLIAVTASLSPSKATGLTRGMLPAVMAAAYSGGMLVDMVNSLGKLFRVDRKVDVFSSDADAGRILGYLLEAQGNSFNAIPAVMREEALNQADGLMSKLAGLLNAIQGATDRLADLKNIEDEEKANPPPTSRLPDTGNITSLNAELANAKSLLESLDPSKKYDDFWAQVKGLLIGLAIKDRDRLLIEVKGQTLQITESRWFRSDRLVTSGEIQVAYRLLDKDGNLKKAAVILKASPVNESEFAGMPATSFQSD